MFESVHPSFLNQTHFFSDIFVRFCIKQHDRKVPVLRFYTPLSNSVIALYGLILRVYFRCTVLYYGVKNIVFLGDVDPAILSKCDLCYTNPCKNGATCSSRPNRYSFGQPARYYYLCFSLT
jgi:hypothetical protein